LNASSVARIACRSSLRSVSVKKPRPRPDGRVAAALEQEEGVPPVLRQRALAPQVRRRTIPVTRAHAPARRSTASPAWRRRVRGGPRQALAGLVVELETVTSEAAPVSRRGEMTPVK
jgi:hypothetical protein